MKKLLSILIFYLFTMTCFAGFTFNNGKHAFIFDSTTTVGLSVTGDISGLGYYINEDKTFFQITEADLEKAYTFNAGDEVKFVKRKSNGAVLKMTTGKTVNGIQLYKIGGNGSGGIQISVNIVDIPYKPLGQPLPGVFVSMLLAILIGAGFIKFSK